jgi:two-component system chemotaxis sensor kinase CheA
VKVSAHRDRDRVLLTIEDDGRGMDPERLKEAAVARGLLSPNLAETLSRREALMLACLPGVSTASSVSDLSGRGVGMDAVKRVVESFGGTLEVESDLGRGTRFTLRLPLTVAVVQVLLIGVGDEIFGLPLVKVTGALELGPADLFSSQGTKLMSHGGELLPVHPLAQLLALPAGPPANRMPYVVIEGNAGKLVLQVDRLLGQEEVVLKPLARPLDRVPGLAGVTILGSGRPIFILDVPRLV